MKTKKQKYKVCWSHW